MERSESKDVSAQHPEVEGDAANALIHRSINDLRRQHIPTTPLILTEDATQDVRYTERCITENHNPHSTHRQSTESPMKTREVDHALQQEANEEVIIPASLSLPNFSVAYQEDFLAEPDHDATLEEVVHVDDGVFTCRINIQILGTAESCTGFCLIPLAEMDSTAIEYYRNLPGQTKDLGVGDVSKGTTFESVSGKVRMGNVTGEDYRPGTYTCEAEFGRFGAANPCWTEVYVPKKHVPDHKIVDYEGEKGAVASIEIVNEEPRAFGGEEAVLPCTVEFSRRIQDDREQMPATFWSPDGQTDFPGEFTQILVDKADGEHLHLRLRVRTCDESWWHLHGTMHRGLTHGRFHTSPSPVPNVQSDALFGVDWKDAD